MNSRQLGKHLTNYQLLILIVGVILLIGIVFYHFVEGLSWIDAYYFCVVTLATIGYGDITPKTDSGNKLDSSFNGR